MGPNWLPLLRSGTLFILQSALDHGLTRSRHMFTLESRPLWGFSFLNWEQRTTNTEDLTFWGT